MTVQSVQPMQTDTTHELDDLLTGNPSELTKPIKSVEEKWRLVPAFLKVRRRLVFHESMFICLRSCHITPASSITISRFYMLSMLLQVLMCRVLVQVRGLVKQQIDSFNFLIEEDLRNIVMAAGNRMLTCDADADWYLQYLDVRVGTPTQKVHYADKRLTPHDCRLRDMTYSAPIMVRLHALHPTQCALTCTEHTVLGHSQAMRCARADRLQITGTMEH